MIRSSADTEATHDATERECEWCARGLERWQYAHLSTGHLWHRDEHGRSYRCQMGDMAPAPTIHPKYAKAEGR